jgi:hypothetical protein
MATVSESSPGSARRGLTSSRQVLLLPHLTLAPYTTITMDLAATNRAPRKRNITSENSTTFRRWNKRPTLSEIPDDLALEILIRLPVKSLLRFKAVCKAWHVTISSQSFIATHLQRSTSNHKCRPSFLITPYLLDSASQHYNKCVDL